MRTKLLVVLAVLLLCILVVPATALADDDSAKIDSSVEAVIDQQDADDTVPVLVYTDAGAMDVVSDVVPEGVDTTELGIVNAVAAYLTPDEIDALAAEDEVQLIALDNLVFGFDYKSSLDVTNLAIGLGDVESPKDGGPTGRGVTVAVLDSGVSTTTSDLAASRIVGWKDFVNGARAPYDDAGHGTFVTGLIAGDGTASLPLEDGGLADVQFRGVAPEADIVGIKVLDRSGQGRASSVIAGIIWAVVHKDRYGIDVLNISIGSDPVAPAEYDPIARACEVAWKHGITVVCAAGNEGEFGQGGILSPGNDPYVITVGATDTIQTTDPSDDVVTYYSSIGPTLFDEYAKPDVVAPGNRLISLRVKDSYIDTNFPENLIPVSSYIQNPPDGMEPSYLKLSGTSTSAPVVSGAAALMLQKDDDLSPDDVKVRLMATADPLPDASGYQQGAGLIDVGEALNSNAHAHGYALSADLGDGTTILSEDNYRAWDKRAWKKYGWMKFKWTKFKWTKFKWTKFKWTKFKWTKFKWTNVAWDKFKWTKFKWTKFKWTEYEWAKFKWTILIEGQ